MDITINKAHIDFKDKVDKLFNDIRSSFNQKYQEKMGELDSREENIVEKEKTIKQFRRQSLLASMDKQVMEKTKEIKFLKTQLEKSKKKKGSSKSDNSKELEQIKKDLEEKNKLIEKLTKEKENADNQIIQLNKKIKELENKTQESDTVEKYSNDTSDEEVDEDDDIWVDIKIKNKQCLLNNETKKVYEVSANRKKKTWIGRLTKRGTFKRR